MTTPVWNPIAKINPWAPKVVFSQSHDVFGEEKEKLQLTPEEEDILQLYFQLIPYEKIEIEKTSAREGHFSKIAMLYDIAEWYESKKYVTRKQYEQLKKHIIDKKNQIQIESLKKEKEEEKNEH
jgi:hypothetical protein